MTKILRYKSWKDFRRFLDPYASQSRERREQLLFRGHANSDWGLETTLDRHRRFDTDSERERYFKALLDEFRREAIGIGSRPETLPTGEAFELLARHHGVPSQLLDWTDSPYIASYFAFDSAPAITVDSVAIWVLDRTKFDPGESSGVDLIDDRELLRFNRRALQQRSLFTRVLTIRESVEHLLPVGALTKLVIPASARAIALADLDAMAINAATLFSDLDGAARTATYRLTS